MRENRSSRFPTRSDINGSVQSQKMVKSLKFRIKEEEKFYYPSGETKGADQLRSYCESNLRLCFRICKIPVFSRCGSFYNVRMVRLGTSFPGQAQTRAVNQ